MPAVPSPTLVELRGVLRTMGDQGDAEQRARYFKTGPGEYGEGDRFLGIRVPQVRQLAGRYATISLDEALDLLRSPWHEERLLALLILVAQSKRGSRERRNEILDLYLEMTERVNNWDLVDASAEHIVGPLFPERPGLLERLARSDIVWERRIAVLATRHWIKQGEFEPTLRIARSLLSDEHDLIHKAVGWMLREIGERDLSAAEDFLRAHYRTMPRTMLRYAIERLPETRRQEYLKGRS